MALAEDFQAILDSLPPDWTHLEADLRIADEHLYNAAATLLTLAFYLWDAFISTAPSRRRDSRWIGRIALLVGLGFIVAAWNLLLRT